MADSPAVKVGSPLAALKKVPNVVWLGVGGAALGLGYRAYRDRNSPDIEPVTTGDMYEGTQGVVAADQLSYAPSPVGYAPSGGTQVYDGADTAGAIGQTALETVGQIATGAIGVIGDQHSTYGTDIAAILAAMPQPQPPPPATPAAPAAPAAPSAPSLPAGYTRGNVINGKTFPGAIGYALVATDTAAGIKVYHIRWPNLLQRWHYDYVGTNKGSWRKVWEKAA